MGKTIEVLAERELPPRAPALCTMLVDLSENVHLHYREMRQEFSVREFYIFFDTLHKMAEDLAHYLKSNPGYREGAVHKTLRKATGAPSMLYASPGPTESAYWPHRLLVELIAPHEMGDVHLHWRDYRIQMSRTEFRALADALSEARDRLDEVEDAHPEVIRREKTTEDIARICREGKSPPPGPGHFVRAVEGGQ